MSQGYLPNKIQCFCGRFCRLGRSRSVLLPALASQGLAARTCLKSARFCPKHFIFSTGRKAKNDIKGSCLCRSAAESRRVCNADLLPQLSCHPNPTQHAFKEHQLAATLLRCASLQCTSVGPCKPWPFVHDQPLARRPQLESRMTCKAVLASEDAQRASLFCFYLLSRA